MKVFYNKKQSTDAKSESPSAGKPAILVAQWLERKQSIEVVSGFAPVTRDQFYEAHDKQHVDDILECRKNNGFYNQLPEIAATLPWTSGSMLAAAHYAWKNQTIAMSPTSGFHHATHNESMGFCTLNGLMVAIFELLKQGAKKVGILDIDHHFGNGTDDILVWANNVKGLNLEQVHHYTFGGDPYAFRHFATDEGIASIWRDGPSAELWLQRLPNIVSAFEGCDVVLYQAGADPHVDDPHGGALTNEQLRMRDQIVFETLTALNVPVAWNLAGGYQTPLQKVLDIHTATLEEALKVLAKKGRV